MSATTVYCCDWCGEEVDRHKDVEGAKVTKYAAKVTWERVWPYPPMGSKPIAFEICQACAKAFIALTGGKYKR